MSFDRPGGHQSRPSGKAALLVTVKDLVTGEESEELVAEGDYVIVTSAPSYVVSTQVYQGGQTHVITVKGRTAT